MNNQGILYSLVLSKRTLDRLRLNADPTRFFRNTAADLGDGWFEVPIAADTHERLETIRCAGESDDDLVTRVLDFHQTGGLN